MTTVISGLAVGLTLIVAIGAQNVFVLRQGARREHVAAVVAVCAGSDVVLIVLGVAGLGRIVDAAPWLVDVARFGGAAFLAGYAVLAARRALSSAAEGLTVAAPTDGDGTIMVRTRVVPVVTTALALTWLNPHVYLDTLFLLGSVAATHGDDRWWFALGAVTASLLWFSALGYGAGRLGRWLESPAAWRRLDAVIAVVMLFLAVRLAIG